MSHQTISFVKSGIRILGYMAICAVGFQFVELTRHILYAGGLLIISEVVGIVEEIGHE